MCCQVQRKKHRATPSKLIFWLQLTLALLTISVILTQQHLQYWKKILSDTPMTLLISKYRYHLWGPFEINVQTKCTCVWRHQLLLLIDLALMFQRYGLTKGCTDTTSAMRNINNEEVESMKRARGLTCVRTAAKVTRWRDPYGGIGNSSAWMQNRGSAVTYAHTRVLTSGASTNTGRSIMASSTITSLIRVHDIECCFRDETIFSYTLPPR